MLCGLFGVVFGALLSQRATRKRTVAGTRRIHSVSLNVHRVKVQEFAIVTTILHIRHFSIFAIHTIIHRKRDANSASLLGFLLISTSLSTLSTFSCEKVIRFHRTKKMLMGQRFLNLCTLYTGCVYNLAHKACIYLSFLTILCTALNRAQLTMRTSLWMVPLSGFACASPDCTRRRTLSPQRQARLDRWRYFCKSHRSPQW